MTAKPPKRPRDLNQFAKFMVDLATGAAVGTRAGQHHGEPGSAGFHPDRASRRRGARRARQVRGACPYATSGRASEIGGTIVFLASTAADFMTGQTIAVNGGRTLS